MKKFTLNYKDGIILIQISKEIFIRVEDKTIFVLRIRKSNKNSIEGKFTILNDAIKFALALV